MIPVVAAIPHRPSLEEDPVEFRPLFRVWIGKRFDSD